MSRTFTYEGEIEDGCAVNLIYVNGGPVGGPMTGVKMLSGDYAFLGPVLEVLDIAYFDEECDGNLVEEEVTFDWYAQDDYQNVWYMGETSRDFGDIDIDGEEFACPTLGEVPLGAPPATGQARSYTPSARPVPGSRAWSAAKATKP